MQVQDRWSRERLESLRHVGDAEADAVIAEVFRSGDLPEVHRLLRSLVDNDDPVPEELPDGIEDYFRDTVEITAAERIAIGIGERFFAVHGPEIMLVLCCASLPFDYANRRAVKVLYQTGFLEKRPNRRVAQTAQMIVDVMGPGGLGEDGYGIRSAQKVRLMHAAIRHLILARETPAWNSAVNGVPINQADLLFTLMSFTQVVLDGLRRLQLEISTQEAESYLCAWRVVGRQMGIQPELIPNNIAEAKLLTARFAELEHAPSLEGRAMTEAIAGLIGDVLGTPLDAFRWSLIRFFVGGKVARMLGVPSHPVRDRLTHSVTGLALLLDTVVDRPGPLRRWFRTFSMNMMQYFIERELGPTSRSFRIPSSLQDGWHRQRRHGGTVERVKVRS